MNEHKCPVCENSQSASSLCKVDGFSIYSCKICSADYVFPMPESESLKAYYDREEWFEGGEIGGYKDYDQQTAWSVNAIKPVLEEFEGQQDLSVLDVGCGYGTHLELASSLGWKCFGVEVSNHARQVAQQRLEGKAYIVEAVEDLIPHEFDLVLILDVIEHLPSPYILFYNLFSIGAITPKTRIVISTPNAGSDEARQNPSKWEYRHPPSHLVYYSTDSLRFLLEKLHFSRISIQGVHPIPQRPPKDDITGYSGLLTTAEGSDFTEFMRERYVPGTWSKIAEYEHLPRYEFAKKIAIGKTVLDFGCGTGYGSAALSQVAENVTGLDIDHAAISWANATHHNPKLTFHRCSDLGSTLSPGSFDVVTCFEMIEHVTYETQQLVIESISRLLQDNGLLIISTPNPEITKLYGANPYHLREMTLLQFRELLTPHFPHIQILEQRVRNSIAFDSIVVSQEVHTQLIPRVKSNVMPLAFIAVCSKQAIEDINSLVVFDENLDLILDTMNREKKLNLARLDAYRLGELVYHQKAKIQNLTAAVTDYQKTFAIQKNTIESHAEEINHLKSLTTQLNQSVTTLKDSPRHTEKKGTNSKEELLRLEEELQTIRQTKWFRLRDVIIHEPWGFGKVARVAYLAGMMATPRSVRAKLFPLIYQMRAWLNTSKPVLLSNCNESVAYQVQHPEQNLTNRPYVIHIIANFMTGGSSRLVVDLIEHLGAHYKQSVVTSFIPTPPAYIGVDITELRFPKNEQLFIDYFLQLKPDLLHIHYWGDSDKPWYTKAVTAAEQLNIPIVENINTPVTPYFSEAVKSYIYVSDYVRHVFGKAHPIHTTIYPGSDFSHFKREPDEFIASNCIGMVYRLEPDKLNEDAITPFIKAVQKRPQTRVLIVGGGSLLKPFCHAVAEAGLSDSFEFTGYVSYDALPDLYRRMSIFVAPVWKESFGQVSPFAMNMQIPVVGYDVGAISEIVVNQTLLAEPENSEMLSNIIVRLLESPEERKKIGEFQHRRAQDHFSVQAMVSAYETIYQKVVADPPLNKDMSG